MTQHEIPPEAKLTRQISDIMREAETELLDAVSADPATHPPRPGLDSEMREIKDNVLRMGSLAGDAIQAAIQALMDHDAAAATEVIVNDRRINEMQRQISTLITRTIATQA